MARSALLSTACPWKITKWVFEGNQQRKSLYSQAGQTGKIAKAWTNSPIQIIP